MAGLIAAAAVSGAVTLPATAREMPYCIKGCDFGGGAGDCSFSTLAQCQATASGRDATCAANPYFNAKPYFNAQGGNADRSQPPTPKEIVMRMSGFGCSRNRNDLRVSAGAGADLCPGLSGLPACLRPGRYYECTYTSLPQCNASASGRSAQCVINPYYAYARQDRPVRKRGYCGYY